MIKYALRYAAKNLRVLPVAGKAYATDEKASKAPLVEHGVHSATTDENLIREWWTRWPLANIAIAIPPEWFVLDADAKHRGPEKVAAWEKQHGALPVTPTQRSGSGGWHMIFARPKGELRGKIEQGIDVLSEGRYFICYPSVNWHGGVYEWTCRAPIARPPPWLTRLVAHVPVPAPTPRLRKSTTDEISTFDRARLYVATMDPAISGSGGHATTFRVAVALVKGFELSADDALEILIEYNERCQPAWTESELRHKVKSAIDRGRLALGWLANAERRSA